MNIKYATCLVCGEDLKQWSEKQENGDRTFWERCDRCEKQWSTGTVTKEEWEVLAGIAKPVINEKDDLTSSDKMGDKFNRFANVLRTTNRILSKRKILK